MAGFIVKKYTPDQAAALGVEDWPLWQDDDTAPIPWQLSRPETFYILTGELSITYRGQEYLLGPGDMAAFPQGMDCLWQIKTLPFTKKVTYHYLDI